MKTAPRDDFDPQAFLVKAGERRTVLAFHGNETVYSQENDGPPVTPPAHRGFGSRVLERGLAYELEGTVHLDYRPNGLVCTMDIPLPRGTRGG